MLRPLYILGTAYLAVCALAFASRRAADDWSATAQARANAVAAAAALAEGGPAAAAGYPGDAGAWFARAKPYCNAVEADVRQRQDPPPATDEGAAYGAACFALAGKIEAARAMIERLPASARPYAAGVVFSVGHSVADAGDDRASGPIMRLVVEYQPNNYMALYHAGMAEYSLGHNDVARDMLRRFVAIYHQEDGWRGNALAVLGRLDGAPSGGAR